jgi:hypothetical protein
MFEFLLKKVSTELKADDNFEGVYYAFIYTYLGLGLGLNSGFCLFLGLDFVALLYQGAYLKLLVGERTLGLAGESSEVRLGVILHLDLSFPL